MKGARSPLPITLRVELSDNSQLSVDHVEHSITPDVGFGEGEYLEGKPVVETLL